MKIHNRCLYSVFLLLHCTSFQAAIVLRADSAAPLDQTFTFTINGHVQNNLANNFYVAADPAVLPGQAKEFALSMVQRDEQVFTAYAPQIVNLNGTPNVLNPLYDKGIAFITLLQGELVTSGGFGTRGEHLIAVAQDDLQTIYMLVNFQRENESRSSESNSNESTDSNASESTSAPSIEAIMRLQMRSATNVSINQDTNIHNIPDANGLVTSGIVGLMGTQSHVLATVKPNSGNFGDAATGVAEIVLGAKNQTAVFSVVDAITGLEGPINKAAPFDRSSSFIKIGNDIVSMDDIVDMHYEPGVGRAYIALRVQAGAAATDGARAIIVAQFAKSDDLPARQIALAHNTDSQDVKSESENKKEHSKNGKEKKGLKETSITNQSESESSSSSTPPEQPKVSYNKIILGEIAPPEAFDMIPNKIIGGIGANSEISILKVRSMRTSTGLYYLIVLGGNDSPANVMQQVYALPLVRGNTDITREKNGMIADKNQQPINGYRGQPEIQFWGERFLPIAAETPSQMPLNSDRAVQIGAGAVPFGAVKDLYVSRDAVFVTVFDGQGSQLPGTFYSQALFDETGLINGWTEWHRVGGHVNQVFGGATDPINAALYSMISVGGQVNTVTRTDWSNGSGDGLAQLVNAFTAALPQACGGIRGLFDLPVNTPGLLNSSLLIGVGNNAIALGQTGIVESGALVPVTGAQFKQALKFENGTVAETLPIGPDNPTIVTISGGALADISPIIAAEVAASATQGWIISGGCGGVAILSDENGAGWDLTAGLGPNFSGLIAGMNFKKIGDYCFVRKLICDNQFLYILTDKKLDRIDLNAGNIGLGNFIPVTLATYDHVPGGNPNGTFLDCVISSKCAFIATSAGLIRSGNNTDIRTSSNEVEMNWTWVPVPECGGPIYKLIPFSISGRAQDLVNFGGNLYALGANRGKERAQLNRFVIAPTDENDPINNMTILPFADLFIKDHLSYLVNFGDLRTVFATDGSVFFHSRSREHGVNARVDALPIIQSPPQSGIRFQGPRSATINIGIHADSYIGAILRDSASGSWLISGDFGIKVNE